MTALYLYDDARARTFEPFALTRPASELRAGALVTRHRWSLVYGVPAAGAIVAPHLADFEELSAPPAATGDLPAGSIIANSRCIPALGRQPGEAELWSCGGRVAAVRLREPAPAESFGHGDVPLDAVAPRGAAAVELAGRWVDEVWHYIRDLPAQLAEDLSVLGPRAARGAVPPASVIGTQGVYVEETAVIEPHVVFDATAGPVLISRGTIVHSFARIAGPCFVGPDTVVNGDRVGTCAIGESCRVRGEMHSTIMLGHANKAHDGFVGHSYLGRWVNLGAGTITSNLKNTYGSVALATPAGIRDTGLQFLGTLFGDHSKTGIGLRLTTGSVLGAGCNVVDLMPPKLVAPFSWGGSEPYQKYRLDKFLEVAERVMARRHVTLGARARRQLAAAHAAADRERSRPGVPAR